MKISIPLTGLILLSLTAACDSGSSNNSSSPGDSGLGTMGSGGTSGADAPSTGPTTVVASMIDDMEDNDGSINTLDGRVGAWYSYNDETAAGTQTPPAKTAGFPMAALDPPRGDSHFAAETTGSGFTTWGAGIGFDLNNDGTTKHPYDASAYRGIAFWAKAGPDGIGAVRVNVQDVQTAPEGGVCDKTATKGCNDHRGSNISLTKDWKQFTLPFDKMKQIGFGMAYPDFKTDQLFAIQFQVGANVKFDFYLDDIGFY